MNSASLPAAAYHAAPRTGRDTCADMLCHWLLAHRMDDLFTVPGAQVLPLVMALARHPALHTLVAAHELGAAYMADGNARATGRPGVCLAIGGPGAGNMVPAAATARIDDSPVLYITGNVATAHAGLGAFQDGGENGSRDAALFGSILEYTWSISTADELPAALEQAWVRLQQHRPVHLVIPIDVQAAMAPRRTRARTPPGGAALHNLPVDLSRLAETLRQARKPLLLAGHRAARPAVRARVRSLAEAWGLPVITTLAAKGLLSEQHPLCLGNAGFAGTPRANRALLDPAVDLLLVLGADLNERDTLAWDRRHRPDGRRLVGLDTKDIQGPDENHLTPDLAGALEQLVRLAPAKRQKTALRRAAPGRAPARTASRYNPRQGRLSVKSIIDTLQVTCVPGTRLFVDSGSVRIFAGQGWCAREPGTFHSAAGYAPMGWAIAAGIGAAARPGGQPVVVLTGDGSALMHGMELATAARYGVNLLCVLIDNGGQGTGLRRFPGESTAARLFETAPIDWVAWARSLGARAENPPDPESLGHCISRTMRHAGPVLIHVAADPDEPFLYPEYTRAAYTPFLSTNPV
jgi:acetolactate synthase-1/2/3 large subunit